MFLRKTKILILVSVLLIIMAFGYCWQQTGSLNWEKIKKGENACLKGLLSVLKQKGVELPQEFKKEVKEMGEDSKRLNERVWQHAWQKIKGVGEKVWQIISETAKKFWQTLFSLISKIRDIIP